MNEVAKTQPKPPNPIARLQSMVGSDAIKKRFNDMLGERSAAFISSILSAVNANEYLSKCDPMSVISAAAIAASMDLQINPSLGFAHIVPYSGKAQFQMGWRGFVQLGMRSGQYLTMNAAKVFEGQLVDHDPFTGQMKFDAKAKKSDKIAGYLFYFKLINGFEKYTFMTREESETHGKRYSQTYQRGKGKWVDDFDAMALKTVVKQGLSKWGVLSVEMQRALEFDQAAVSPTGEPEFIDTPEAEDQTGAPETAEEGPTRLKKLIAEGKKEEPPKLTPEENAAEAVAKEVDKL